MVTLANVQKFQIKYGKLPAKKAKETPWNKLFVDIIFHYVIIRKVNK